MAARRTRNWIAIGGATAAVAIGAFAAVALGALTGLTAASPTGQAAQLSWTDDTAATSFDVERSTGSCPGVSYSMVAPGLAGGTSGTFTDALQPDGPYCYRVTGHYDQTNGPVADSVLTKDVRIDTTPPSVPAFSPIVSPTRLPVTLAASSTDPDGEPAPTVTITINGGGFASGAGSAGASWTSASDGTYTIVATATDAVGHVATNSILVTVDNTPPAAPTDVHPFQSPTTGSPILLWTAVQGETYHVARTSSTGPGPRSFPTAATPGWQDPDTPPPGTYTYVVTATDPVGNTGAASAPTTVNVINISKTAPRSIAANSPTNTVPHVTWQPPVSFLVGAWNIYRDGVLLTTLGDASANSFDDTALAAQGPHTYAVQAVNDTQTGDISSPVSVTFDTMAPALSSASATANPDGSISLNWPDAIDPTPGSGLAKYLVQRVVGSSPPSDPNAGTTVCTPTPPANACKDGNTKNNTTYSYGIFAIDAAGNVAWRGATARSVDTTAPDAVNGLKIVSFDRSYARIGWTVPALKDENADIAGYRVLQLRTVGKPPLNPNDGKVVCRNDDPKDNICDVLNLVTGKKVSFAVYAYDAVPNYSPPVMISMRPHNIDNTPPHKPTKVRLTHSGLTYTLRWVSPRDKDLSKFRVTLYDKGPAKRPSLGKAVVTGRVLHATFTLRPGQVVYVNLFALDVSTNFSRVTKLIVAPGKIVAKSKHKVAKKKLKKTAGKTTQPAKPKKTKKS